MPSRSMIDLLLSIVIGLSLVGTVATTSSSASTSLASFSGAQALVIIVPLIFRKKLEDFSGQVAVLLYDAYSHIKKA